MLFASGALPVKIGTKTLFYAVAVEFWQLIVTGNNAIVVSSFQQKMGGVSQKICRSKCKKY